MEGSTTSQTPGNQTSKNVELPDDVEEYMQMAARMLYDIIVDYRKRHPEKVKQPDEPTDATKNEKSP